MVFQLFACVGRFAGVDQLADLDDRLVIRGFNEPKSIIGWKHKRLLRRVTISFNRIDFNRGKAANQLSDVLAVVAPLAPVLRGEGLGVRGFAFYTTMGRPNLAES